MNNSTGFTIQNATTIEPANSTDFNFTTLFFENVTNFINYTTEYITHSASTTSNNEEKSKDNTSLYLSIAATIIASASIGFGLYNCYKNYQNRMDRDYDNRLTRM